MKLIGFAYRFLLDTEKKYAINELAAIWGSENFHLYIYGKRIELIFDSARLTRRLDIVAHLAFQIKDIACKQPSLTEHLSRNPVANPEPNYHEE